MENIIKAAVERGASDLHIKAGDVFEIPSADEETPFRFTPELIREVVVWEDEPLGHLH